MQILDLTDETCPMNLVKTKLKLNTLKKGDTLSLFIKEGEQLDNIKISLKNNGYFIKEITLEYNDVYKIIVIK